MKHFLSFVLPIFLSFGLYAQCEQCNAALRNDILLQSGSLYESASFLQTVSEQEFMEFKRNASAGISIPILSDLVSASADYAEFQKKIRNFTQEIRSSWQRSSQYDYKSVRTSPIAYDQWGKCMENCLQRPGLVLIKTKENEIFGSFKVKYIPGPNDPNTVRINISIASENSTKDTVITLNKNGHDIIDFRRTYTNGLSKTKIKASIKRSYAEEIESDYAKIPQNRVQSIDYKYEVKTSIPFDGQSISTCNMDITMQNIRDVANCLNANSSIIDGKGRSCDDKFDFVFYKVAIIAPTGYRFENDILSDNIIYDGEGAIWNFNNCNPKQFNVLVSNPGYKQIRVALGSKPTNVHIRLNAVKEEYVPRKTYPFQTTENVAQFAIDNDKLTHYSIIITLENGKTITIDEHSPGVIKKVENDKTIFTVPI